MIKNNYKFPIAITLIVAISSVLLGIKIVHGHIGITAAPTTTCADLDSTDLRIHTANQIDERLALASSSNGLTMYTSRDFSQSTSTNWTVNPDSWTKKGTPLDFTGISGYLFSTSNSSTRLGTMISPRHFVSANHYTPIAGETLGFIDADGNRIERTVSGVSNVSGTDISVGVLDSDIPDSITYYSIIASSTLSSLIQLYNTGNIDIPIVVFDQEAKALIHLMTSPSNTGISHASTTVGVRAGFSEQIIGGDSGNPGFLIIDNKPIILFAHGGDSNGPNYGNYISEINAKMTTLGGGYQITEYNPTCFVEQDLNHYPVFYGTSSIATRIATSSQSVIHTVTLTDADVGQTISYDLAALSSADYPELSLTPSTYFTINSSGQIFQMSDIDTSTIGDTLNLTVRATDNGANIASATVTYAVDVRPLLDQSGRIVFDPNYSMPVIDSGTSASNLAFNSDGSLVVTGSFTSINGTAQRGIAKLNAEGILDTAFSLAMGSGLPSGARANSVAIDSGGGVAILASGVSPVTFDDVTTGALVKLNSDGSLDTDFTSGVSTGFSNGSTAKVFSIGDKFFIAGLGAYNGGVTKRLTVINADGSLDSTFHTNFGTLNSTGPRSLASSGNDLYAGGNFTLYTRPDTTTITTNRIAKFNIDGTFDETFAINVDTGFSSSVEGIAIRPDGKIVAVGGFTSFDGVSSPGIVLLNSDGTLDEDFSDNLGTGFSATLFAVVVQDDNKIIVGGNNNTFNGTSTKGLIRLNADGTLDTDFKRALGDGVNGGITRLALRSDGAIGITGNLNDYNTVLLNNSAVILTTETPVAPSAPDLLASYDLGSSSSDNITTETTVVFSGTGSSTAALSLYAGDTLIDTSTVDDDGIWYATSTLAVGSYSITALQTLSFLTTEISATSSALSLTISAPEASSSSGGGGGGSSRNTSVSDQNILLTPNLNLIKNISPSNLNSEIKTFSARSMTVGSAGGDAAALQRYLNNKGFVVSSVGAGAPGFETSYFGLRTKSALAKFQVSVGIKPALGYFGPITRKYILEH